MRIGIDARFFGPESKGLGRYTQKLIEHLEDIDHENDYVIFLRHQNFDTYIPKNYRFTKVRADYKWYTLAEQFFMPHIFHKAKCDFIHFPHFNVPYFYRGKFLVTIHDLILLHFPTQKASTRSRWIYAIKFFGYKHVIRNAINRAEHIFAVSHFTKKDIAKIYPNSRDKISVTHEAPDISGRASPSVHVSKSAPYFLYVGNAYPHKNLSFLLDVFLHWQKKTGNTHKLILVGRNDYFYDNLQKEITTKKIENVEIKDTVSDTELTQLYLGAKIFLFPSLYEGFGLPPLEAMLYGVPVISSSHDCMREILGTAALYVDPQDIHGFVQEIDSLLNDSTQRKRLISQGYLQAKKYTWQSTAQATHDVYKMQASC